MYTLLQIQERKLGNAFHDSKVAEIPNNGKVYNPAFIQRNKLKSNENQKFLIHKGYSAKKGMLKNTIVRIAILIVLIFLKL